MLLYNATKKSYLLLRAFQTDVSQTFDQVNMEADDTSTTKNKILSYSHPQNASKIYSDLSPCRLTKGRQLYNQLLNILVANNGYC